MTSSPSKLEKMATVVRSLKEAAALAWSKGHLNEARGLHSRADIAESRVRDLELAAIAAELGKSKIVITFGGGAHLL